MKTTLSIIRIIILLSLGTVAVFGIFCTPSETSEQWITDFFTSKAIGLFSFWAFIRLYRIWRLSDPAVNAYDEAQSRDPQ